MYRSCGLCGMRSQRGVDWDGEGAMLGRVFAYLVSRWASSSCEMHDLLDIRSIDRSIDMVLHH